MDIKKLSNKAIAEAFVVNYAANLDVTDEESELMRRGLPATALFDIRCSIPSEREIEDMDESAFEERINECVATVLELMPSRIHE